MERLIKVQAQIEAIEKTMEIEKGHHSTFYYEDDMNLVVHCTNKNYRIAYENIFGDNLKVAVIPISTSSLRFIEFHRFD